MENWEELFEGKLFITDIGEALHTVVNGKEVSLGRYAVFSPNKGQPGHQAIEVGADVDVLARKYGISADCICVLSGRQEETK